MGASWTSETSKEMILDNTDVRQKMTVGETAVFIQLKCSVSVNLHRGFFLIWMKLPMFGIDYIYTNK